MFGKDIQSEYRGVAVNGRGKNADNCGDGELSTRQDFNDFYDHSVRSALLDSYTAVDRLAAAAAAADVNSNDDRPRPHYLHHVPFSPPQQTTSSPNPLHFRIQEKHTEAELPVLRVDWDSTNGNSSTHHVTKRHSFTSLDQSTIESNHYFRRYPTTGNCVARESPPSDTRRWHRPQSDVVDEVEPTSPHRLPYRSSLSVFSPTPRRRLQVKPPPSRLDSSSVPVSVAESPDHGYVTLERVQWPQTAVPSKMLCGDDSIVPVLSADEILIGDHGRQADFIRSRSTAALQENGVERLADGGRVNDGYVRRRQRPKWSGGDTDELSIYQHHQPDTTARLNEFPAKHTNEFRGGNNCNSSDVFHFEVDTAQVERSIRSRDLKTVSNVAGLFNRYIIRAASDSRIDLSFDKCASSGTPAATRHRPIELNGSRGKSTGSHGSSDGDVIRRLVSDDVARRGQENSVSVLSVRVNSVKCDFSDDQFQNNCYDTRNTRHDCSPHSFKPPARCCSDAVAVSTMSAVSTVSSCPQPALCCPSSGEVVDGNNGDVVRDGLRRLLEQRDDELLMLRSTIHNNEMAMLNVIDDSRRAAEAELSRCCTAFERRLRSEVETARRTERTLQAEIDQLESINAALRRSASEAKPSASCSSVFYPGTTTDVDRFAAVKDADFRPVGRSLDAVNSCDSKGLAVVNGVDVSTAVPLLDGDRQRSAPAEVPEDYRSPSSEVGKLQRCLRLANGELDLARKEFADARSQWLMEKERVIAYQLQLQLNYVQTMKRNAALETELRQLREELVQLAATFGLRRVGDERHLQQRQYLIISDPNAARSAGLNEDRPREDAVQPDESTC